MAPVRDLATAFGAQLPPGEQEKRATEALELLLESTVEKGRSAWPRVQLDPTVFVAYLAERIDPALAPAAALAMLRVEQLYLACACAHQDAAAIAVLEAECIATLGPAIQPMDRTGTLVDDTKQAVRQRLLCAETGLPRITQYAGRGALRSWVRATAIRIALNLLRGTCREISFGDDMELFSDLAVPDIELSHMKERYRADLKEAFASALRSLTSEQQALLQYHYFDGLNIDQIGKIYDIHRVTAFRRLERARRQLISQTRKRLREHLQVDHGEFDSIMRLIQTRLDLTIQQYFSHNVQGQSGQKC